MQTVDPAVLDALERIAVAQVVVAVVMCLLGVIALGAAVIGLMELRSARRLVRGMGETLDELKPRLAPLLDSARSVADDAAGMTDDVRRRMDAILHTVEDLHRALQRGGAAAEQRVRRLNAVLDVVQTETEELLLDAAAAAHGVHETARVLREPAGRGRARRRDAETRHDTDSDPGIDREALP